jgi:4-hydroxy-2-oxoheptanedioate aldolase
MDIPRNAFKAAIKAGTQQIGLWCTLANSYALEAVAGAPFDWFLIDTEHSPQEMSNVLPQLQTLAAYPTSAVVRPAFNDEVLIKRLLDIGAQTLLIPMVNCAQDAERAVASMRYPPKGIRGVSSVTRATRFGRVKDYDSAAETELCLIVQVETVEALNHIEAIAAVDGVDAIFVGPADLAASMGYLGKPDNPEVCAAVLDAIRRIRKAGLPAGLLTPDADFARACIAAGSVFTAVGVDAALLARASDRLATDFRSQR